MQISIYMNSTVFMGSLLQMNIGQPQGFDSFIDVLYTLVIQNAYYSYTPRCNKTSICSILKVQNINVKGSFVVQ